MASPRPNQVLVTADNRGPLINIAAWLCLAVAAGMVFITVPIKLVKTKRLNVDDGFIILALLVLAAFTAAVTVEVQHGLGQPQAKLSMEMLLEFQKAELAQTLLYLLTIFLARLATLCFLYTLSPQPWKRGAARSSIALATVVFVAGFLTLAFRCPVPNTWAFIGGRCIDQTIFWDVYGSFDILLDVVISAVPILVIYPIQMKRSKKIRFVISFSGRIITIPAAIVRLVYISQYYSSSDFTWTAFNTTLTTCVLATLHVVLTCFSFVRPLHDGVFTGLLATPAVGTGEDRNKSRHVLSLLTASRRGSSFVDAPEGDVSLQHLMPAMPNGGAAGSSLQPGKRHTGSTSSRLPSQA